MFAGPEHVQLGGQTLAPTCTQEESVENRRPEKGPGRAANQPDFTPGVFHTH